MELGFRFFVVVYLGLVITTCLLIALAYYSWKGHQKTKKEYEECEKSDKSPPVANSFLVWFALFLSIIMIIVTIICIPIGYAYFKDKTPAPGNSTAEENTGGSSAINWASERLKDGINAEVQPGKHGITLYFGDEKNIKQVDLSTELPFPLGHPKTFKVPLSTRGLKPTSGDISIKVQPNAPKTEIITLDKYGTKMEGILVGGKPTSGSGGDRIGYESLNKKLPKVPLPPYSGKMGTLLGGWQKESGYKKTKGSGTKTDPYIVSKARPSNIADSGGGKWKDGSNWFKQG